MQWLAEHVFGGGELSDLEWSFVGEARSKTLGAKAKFPASSMSWEWAEVAAWTRRQRNMASDFQRPSGMMASVPTLAQSRTVVPPGNRERAVTLVARVPMSVSCALAACWMALVMWVDLAGVGWLIGGCRFCVVCVCVVVWALSCLRRLVT